MKKLTLYRKRLIPNENILLKDDIVLLQTDQLVVTRWNTLHPGRELHHGMSCYYLKDGFKVSMFCREDDSLMYWYCDIVDYEFHEQQNELVVTDLLADVILYEDGSYKVVDLDELAQAASEHLITQQQSLDALIRLNRLLVSIYDNRFASLTQPILDLKK